MNDTCPDPRPNRADSVMEMIAENERLRAEMEELVKALRDLTTAQALSGVRELVAGWNGENRPEGLFSERHPRRLGATLPKTDCGAIYDLDEALTRARALTAQQEGDGDD